MYYKRINNIYILFYNNNNFFFTLKQIISVVIVQHDIRWIECFSVWMCLVCGKRFYQYISMDWQIVFVCLVCVKRFYQYISMNWQLVFFCVFCMWNSGIWYGYWVFSLCFDGLSIFIWKYVFNLSYNGFVFLGLRSN